MPRYVDADMLREMMYHEAFEKDSQDQKWDSGCWIRYRMFENAVDSIPTADVVERKKGEWIKRGVSLYRCSECGRFSPSQENYCPSCGSYNGEEKDNA